MQLDYHFLSDEQKWTFIMMFMKPEENTEAYKEAVRRNAAGENQELIITLNGIEIDGIKFLDYINTASREIHRGTVRDVIETRLEQYFGDLDEITAQIKDAARERLRVLEQKILRERFEQKGIEV